MKIKCKGLKAINMKKIIKSKPKYYKPIYDIKYMLRALSKLPCMPLRAFVSSYQLQLYKSQDGLACLRRKKSKEIKKEPPLPGLRDPPLLGS